MCKLLRTLLKIGDEDLVALNDIVAVDFLLGPNLDEPELSKASITSFIFAQKASIYLVRAYLNLINLTLLSRIATGPARWLAQSLPMGLVVNNHKVPLWNKNPFKRLVSLCLDVWLPFIPGWLVGVLCWLLYHQAFRWMTIGSSSLATPIEFAIVSNGIFISVIIALLTAKYWSEVTCNLINPLPVSISGDNTGHTWGSQNNFHCFLRYSIFFEMSRLW